MSEVVGRGTLLAGRYRVLQQVEGDVPGASAWQAVDQILDRPVRALVMHAGPIASALDGARRAALVADPRLVRVLDVGTHEDLGYVVCEQVSGPSLARIADHEPLTADQARAVVGETASALEAARRRGVHHLALRPSAVHVADGGRVVLTGLGTDAPLAGVPGGDARTTSRRDSVALVRLLYAALTGRWPADPAGDPLPAGLPLAPVVDGRPALPSELVPGVPGDLDTLCHVTLSTPDDGPHTPGDLVRDLEPWGEIRALLGSPVVGTAGGAVAAAAGSVTNAVTPASGIRAAMPEDDLQDTGPIQVQRQSVRSAFAGEQPAARPGTPPPAVPPRTPVFPAGAAAAAATGAGGGAGVAGPPSVAPGAARPPAPSGSTPTRVSAGAASAAPPPRPPSPVPSPVPAPAPTPAPAREPAPAAAYYGGGFDDVLGATNDDGPERRQFNPTAMVLTIVGIAVIVGVVLAFKALFSSLDTGSSSQEQEPQAPVTQTSAAPTPSASDAPTSAAPTGPPPQIQSATTVDPSDDDGEHQEAVDRAFDGDTSTYWYTQTYQRPDFAGFKPGVGYVMTLAQPTTVSKVRLLTGGTGGQFEIRASDASDPSGGTLLATGAFGTDVAVDLDPPTQTSTLTLWITELPTAADGAFRLELQEIELS
ncbi:protein kinase family protein [Cellulomonas composti]|uniref:Protein kinase domain-containing protein n=1 Tax=Cellulomonas composti TaxID=266130 RepID=A0A511JDT7_9CELL|nr:protein kinase family protein [Cellulomonas composti]GEL96145.1 hypothetical protein CCO02nite_28030 [Cellulomonas composti]